MTRLASLATVAVAVACVLGLAASPSAQAAGGTWVSHAQRRLDHLGCRAGPADGSVDRHTRSAVVRFQTRTGLPRTGHLDRATRRALLSERARRCDRRPVPARSGTGRRIVISQQQNWIWLVRATGSVVAQGGMIDNPAVLRPGSHRTGSYCGRAARVKLNRSGSLWLDNFVRFAPCGIGFHRIPRSMSTGRQIHPDWFLGTNYSRSHGCIRLSRPLSLKVWSWTAGPRTRVVVR